MEGRRRGRPRKETNGRSHRITFRLMSREYFDLLRCTVLEHVSITEYLRDAINNKNAQVRYKHGLKPHDHSLDWEEFGVFDDCESEDWLY